MEGVKYVRANAGSHSAVVQFDDAKAGINDFAEALSRKGYHIEGAPEWLE